MQFEFYESKDKFLTKLQLKIKESSNDYICEYPDELHINIGFHRLGHSGGRWFIADIICKNNHTTLNGSFKDIFLFSQKNYKSRISEFLTNILIYLIMYFILHGIFLIIWLFIRFNYIILFALPIIIIFLLLLNGTYTNHKIDKKFIDFMINEIGCNYSL